MEILGVVFFDGRANDFLCSNQQYYFGWYAKSDSSFMDFVFSTPF